MTLLSEGFVASAARVNSAQAECAYTQHTIHDYKDVLILYCQ